MSNWIKLLFAAIFKEKGIFKEKIRILHEILSFIVSISHLMHDIKHWRRILLRINLPWFCQKKAFPDFLYKRFTISFLPWRFHRNSNTRQDYNLRQFNYRQFKDTFSRGGGSLTPRKPGKKICAVLPCLKWKFVR